MLYQNFNTQTPEAVRGILTGDGACDDAASAILGGDWRMPTSTELNELIKNCIWELTTINGIGGYKVTSKAADNVNSIFLPASGYYNDSNLTSQSQGGYYWSCTRGTDFTKSYTLYFNSSTKTTGGVDKYSGCNIRPVSPTKGIDLGLPSGVKWASSNLTVNGLAENETDYGDYFAWGELTPKNSYTWNNYKHAEFPNLLNLPSTYGDFERGDVIAARLTVTPKGEYTNYVYSNVARWVHLYSPSPELYVIGESYTLSGRIRLNSYTQTGVDATKYNGISIRFSFKSNDRSNIILSKTLIESNLGTWFSFNETLTVPDGATMCGMEFATDCAPIEGQTTKSTYDFDIADLKITSTNPSITKYNTTDNLTTLQRGSTIKRIYKDDEMIYSYTECDDAARTILGEDWRMPTLSELTELKNNCTVSLVTLNGVQCYKLKSNYNDQYLVFPYTSRFVGSNIEADFMDNAFIMASTVVTKEDKSIIGHQRMRLRINSLGNAVIDVGETSATDRHIGITIRSVSPTKGIDLGLPSGLKWASSNLTATGLAKNETDTGDYFAWGETKPKASYTWGTYKWGTQNNITKYNSTDGLTQLELNDGFNTTVNPNQVYSQSITAHVGDDPYPISYTTNSPITYIHSTNPEVASADNDKVYINADYYRGLGKYVKLEARISLYNKYGLVMDIFVDIVPEARLSEASTYTNPDTLTMESIEFVRTFKDASVDTWQTIYLPFAIDIKAHAADFYVARLYGYDYIEDSNGDGIVGEGDDKWVIQKIATSGVTRANEPMLVMPKHAGDITFRAYDNILAAAKNDTIRMADTIVSAADKVYEIVCSYNVDTLKPGGNNFYIAANGKFSYRSTSATSLNYVPYRWYFHVDSKDGEIFQNYDASGLKQYIVDSKFVTAKSVDTVVVNAGEIFDAEKFCYHVNCAPFAPLSSIESSDETVAWIESGVFHAAEFAYDGHGKISDSNRSCKLTLRTEYGSVTVVNLVVKTNTAKLSEAKTYTNSEDLQMESIKFTRSFSQTVVDNNAWQAIYLPFGFDVAKHADDFDVAELYDYCAVSDNNKDGVIDENDLQYIVFTRVSSGTTKPNVPLMIRPKRAGSIDIVSEGTLYAAKNDTVNFESESFAYSIRSSYDKKELVAGDNNFYVTTTGSFSYRTSSSSNYPPYRWHVKVSSKNGLEFDPKSCELRYTVQKEALKSLGSQCQ